MMWSALFDSITIAIAFVTLIFVLIRDSKANKKDLVVDLEKDEARLELIRTDIVKLDVKLSAINNTTNETRSDVKSNNKELSQLREYLSIHDTQLNSLEHRISLLESKL